MLKKSSFELKIKFGIPKICHPTSGVDTEPKVLFGRPKQFTCISLIHEIRFCDLWYSQEHEISTTLPSLCPVGFQNPNAVQPAGVFNHLAAGFFTF